MNFRKLLVIAVSIAVITVLVTLPPVYHPDGSLNVESLLLRAGSSFLMGVAIFAAVIIGKAGRTM